MKSGQIIALSGNTGENTTGHIYISRFGMIKGNKSEDLITFKMLKRYLAQFFSLIVKKIESTYNKAPELQAKILNN